MTLQDVVFHLKKVIGQIAMSVSQELVRFPRMDEYSRHAAYVVTNLSIIMVFSGP